MIVMALGFLAWLVIARIISRRSSGPSEVPWATWPLTRNEQAMYYRLQGALPDLIVLSQVSFGALLAARAWAVRNTFDRKRADFVICEKSFKVVAIVELDDSSHDGNEARDEQRDAQLINAGYRVLRYRGIPNIDRVQADFAPPQIPPALYEGGSWERSHVAARRFARTRQASRSTLGAGQRYFMGQQSLLRPLYDRNKSQRPAPAEFGARSVPQGTVSAGPATIGGHLMRILAPNVSRHRGYSSTPSPFGAAR